MSPEPSEYQPPLRWYSHAWRYTLALAIGVLVWIPVIEAQAEDHPLLLWTDLVVGIAVLVLVWWRRRWPMTIAVVAVLTTPISSLAGGPITLATVSLATRRRWWQVIVIGLLSLATTWLYYQIQPVSETDPIWLVSLLTVVVISASLAWGMYIGSRRELIWTLRQRAETAEAERDLRVGQARSTERERIAREMHDVLAHRISQISMHAGALTYREDLSAEEMRASVGVIQEKAHEALLDLRGVLGVLRDGTGAPLTGPQPTYGDVAVLVSEAREAGAQVVLDEALDGAPVPDLVGRTVFRVVQEGITNARKHAPAAAVRVRVAGTPEDGIDVEVRNGRGFGSSGTPGAGLGLVGLEERAALAGGRLTHGVEGDSFVLRAWLPWAT